MTTADIHKAAAAAIVRESSNEDYDHLYGAAPKTGAAVAEWKPNATGKKVAEPTDLTFLDVYILRAEVKPFTDTQFPQEKLNLICHPVVHTEDGGKLIHPTEIWHYTSGISTVPARTIIGALDIHDWQEPLRLKFEFKGTWVKTKVSNLITGQSVFNQKHYDACCAIAAANPFPDGANKYQIAEINDKRNAEYTVLNKALLDEINA